MAETLKRARGSQLRRRARRCAIALLAAALAGRTHAGAGPDDPAQAPAPPPLQGLGLAEGLFSLREMDFHLHSGLERPVDLDRWLELAEHDGRRVVLLLDHLELYRKEPWKREHAKGKPGADYPPGPAGQRALFADFDAAALRHPRLLVFKGWEVNEDELDTGLELDALRRADAIGWHIQPRHGHEPPSGQTLIRRVRQLRELQRTLPIPMILFHPLAMRLENLQRAAAAQGRDVASITAAEYRFYAPGEQEQLIELLRGTSIYLELSRNLELYFPNPACREALIADLAPLVRAGVQFTISTDTHRLAQAEKPFEPQAYAGPLGVSERGANALVRELLALRARRALTAAPTGP